MSKTDLLQKDWRFHLDLDERGEEEAWFKSSFSKEAWRSVRVPGAWDFYSPEMRGYEGVGYYALTLPQSKIKTGHWQRLRFPRAFNLSKVWINGKLAATNECGFLPFTLDLTPFIRKATEQHIVISCDNRVDPARLPGAKVVEWQQYGGLHESPALLTSATTYLEDLHIDSRLSGKKAESRLCATVRNTQPSSIQGKVFFEVKQGKSRFKVEQSFSCPGKSTIHVEASINIENPVLWSPTQPALYQATAEIKTNAGTKDSLAESFGIRSITTKGRQILLNGKALRIRGFCRYDDLPGKGWSVSQREILEDLREIKRTGANLIRTHYPHPKRFYQAADEVGLMVMAEVPLCWWRSEWHGPWEPKYQNMEVIDKAEQALERLVQLGKNHPSIVAWSMGNECETRDELGIKAMRRLLARAKSLDASRLAVFVSAGNVRGHDAMREADVICSNIYWGLFMGPVARNLSELKLRAFNETHRDVLDMKKQYPDKPLVITEFGTFSLHGLHGPRRLSEEYQAAYVEGVYKAIMKADRDAGAIVWVWADYYHRRGFTGHGPMFPSDYGPYGVVTFDRKKKKVHAAISRLWKSTESL